MATPPPRGAVRKRPRSPVEDGEVGETAQDVLIRHPLLSPGERRSFIEDLDDLESEVSALKPAAGCRTGAATLP